MYVTIDEWGRFDAHEGDHELADLQAWVGGYVEHLDGPHGLDVWINEEGKLKNLLINYKVTDWMTSGDRMYLMPGDMVVGKVVLTGMNEKRLTKFREEFDNGILIVEV